MASRLQACLQKKEGLTIIIGVGNTMRQDDGVGPYIISKIGEHKGLKTIDAGSMPENHADEIIRMKPSRVIFIDAADFAGRPGEARLLARSQLPQCTLSTHAFPLAAVAGIIEADTAAEMHFIGIQAKSMDLTEGLNKEVKKTADQIAAMIEETLSA